MRLNQLPMVVFLLFILEGCKNDNILTLRKIELRKGVEMDILEDYPDIKLKIVDIIDKGSLGHFTSSLAIVKNGKNEKQVIYELEQSDSEWGRLSKNYIAFVKPYTNLNHGWISKRDGVVINSIPGLKRVIDSLKEKDHKNHFIKEVNGYIYFYDNGVVVKKFNYGNYLPGLKQTDFDSMDYKLYKFDRNSLVVVSENGNDINLQKDGLFFIPAPGFDVIRKFDKEKLVKLVDSVVNSSNQPQKIKIDIKGELFNTF